MRIVVLVAILDLHMPNTRATEEALLHSSHEATVSFLLAGSAELSALWPV